MQVRARSVGVHVEAHAAAVDSVCFLLISLVCHTRADATEDRAVTNHRRRPRLRLMGSWSWQTSRGPLTQKKEAGIHPCLSVQKSQIVSQQLASR